MLLLLVFIFFVIFIITYLVKSKNNLYTEPLLSKVEKYRIVRQENEQLNQTTKIGDRIKKNTNTINFPKLSKELEQVKTDTVNILIGRYKLQDQIPYLNKFFHNV